jgi:hypothetical protein
MPPMENDDVDDHLYCRNDECPTRPSKRFKNQKGLMIHFHHFDICRVFHKAGLTRAVLITCL